MRGRKMEENGDKIEKYVLQVVRERGNGEKYETLHNKRKVVLFCFSGHYTRHL
jgi:hypothetical protein